MWLPEDDVLLEAATYYKESNLKYKKTTKLSPKYFIDPPEFELADDDSYYEKYGKIFATTNRLLVFHCSYCKKKYGTLFDFLQHISAKHLNEQKGSVIEETKQEKESDAEDEETSSQAADMWDVHELPLEELISDNDEDLNYNISEKSSVPSIKKQTWNNETNRLYRTRTISRITHSPLIKRNAKIKIAPESLNKRNSINKIKSEPLNARRSIERTAESTQEERTSDQQSDDTKTVKKKSELSKKGIKSRKVTKKPRKPLQLQCDICDKIFSQRIGLKFHLMSHSDFKAYECKICGNTIKYKNNISKHMLRHTNEKDFQCDLCDKSFFTRTEVKVHRRIHTGERPYVCSICGATFKTTGSLSGHTRRHKNLYIRKCDVCGKGFIGKCELKEHMIKHTDERPYDCTYCTTKFACRKTLLQHIKLHINAKEYVCSFCDKAYNQKSALVSHIKNNHKKLEKPD